MTSRIIVAIVAAVLSLAAPVAVDAQTPTLTLTTNRVGQTVFEATGFSSGTYYSGQCMSETTFPASCPYNNMGRLPAEPGHVLQHWPCFSNPGHTVTSTSDIFVIHQGYGMPTSRLLRGRYRRRAVYSDANCQTEIVAQTYTYPATMPTFQARDITSDSATIYYEGRDTYGLDLWRYTLSPGSGDCTLVRVQGYQATEVWPILTGLSPGTTYTYRIYPSSDRYRGVADSEVCVDSEFRTSVTFTTPVPPGPAPPTGVEATAVEATTDGSGSVTLSWSNPGDPEIATYEYYLQRAGGPAGEWRTVAGSNADTTSVTIDLTTGEAVAGNTRGVTPPMVEWTIYLRARGINGAASRATSTVVSTGAGSGTVVPALPLAGLVTLAVVLFLGGAARRKGLQP